MIARCTYPFLFLSGLSALTYQVVWMREFRLVFGASTASTAAVSALFMAGLGVGGWLLGPRADREPRPLLLYAKLELAIAVLAALSPLLLMLTRSLYLRSGGMMVLGMGGATLARLALAAVVLGVPTFLMGGTLPAAVRAVTAESDGSRRSLGLLYGVNTLGALTGTLLTTFLLLEFFGARATLFMAVAVNILVALAAMAVGRRMPAAETPAAELPAPRDDAAKEEPAGIRPELALATAAGVGFAFFLMELVWYRMLAPILGGSTYTFGLILSVALAGIGLGGAAYPLLMRNRRPSAGLLAGTCLLEALAMLVPYAAGDWVAALAAQLMPLSALGFGGLVGAWTLVAVVFPAAFVSGVQFPLLIALLGRGTRDIGRQTGRAYACNTVGCIAGSLAGGFGLLPWLTAPGCWLLAGGLLTLFGVAIAVASRRSPARGAGRAAAELGAAAALLALLAACFAAAGPTAAWRHSPVGAGRIAAASSTLQTKAWMAERRWYVGWEADGVESAIGILEDDGYSFFVNGKSDGNVLGDRGTQIMCGMVGAALHPAPKKSMVVGLGTGCTAGWLAAVEGMERVDVVELEPAVLHMARLCSLANLDVVGKAEAGKGVRIIVNDAREVLTTVPEKYDVIASEPSNPYRAGIASLFTVEFYEEVKARLAPGGLFVSWCQAYEIDAETAFTIMATLKHVFPFVECWSTQTNDLVFVASLEPVNPNPTRLAMRLEAPAFRDAMRIAWGMEGLEGFLSRFVARDSFVGEAVASHKGPINTDDLMHVEYDYARTVGRSTRFSMLDLMNAAIARGAGTPEWMPDTVDRDAVALNWGLYNPFSGQTTIRTTTFPQNVLDRLVTVETWRQGRLADAAKRGISAVRPPHRLERLAVAESLADGGDDAALGHIAAFEDWWPACAAMVRARHALAKQDYAASAAELEKAFALIRESPWEARTTIDRGLNLANVLAERRPEYAGRMYDALFEPFSLRFLDIKRRNTLLTIAMRMDARKREAVLLRWFEPHHPWSEQMLTIRADCYRETGNPLLKQAEADLRLVKSGERASVEELLTQDGDSGKGE